MDVVAAAGYAELTTIAADAVCRAISLRPDSVVMPATGNTPMGLYEELSARGRRGEVDTSHVRIFQLDEYVGIPEEDQRSLYGWMQRRLLRPLTISDDRVTRLDGQADDVELVCERYDRELSSSGGIDLAILGLGPNGHLGYNEPPVPVRRPDASGELDT